MRIRLDTIGCRLNISEIETIAHHLTRRGHRIVGPGDPAELVIFNTCAVTQTAGRKSRQIIRQLKRTYPQAAIVVTGCYAQLTPQTVKDLGAHLIISNRDKDQLPDLLAQAGLLTNAEPLPPDGESAALHPTATTQHTRAFIKVQDGCDSKCTFCIVTTLRGPARSRPIGDIIQQINRLSTLGYQEAVLSGINLSSYGYDHNHGLTDLVQAILTHTGLPRLRLSSLEPWNLDRPFFDLWQNPRLLPHLHLPLQSGCDATLRRMARRTSQAKFSALVEQARAAIPNLAITSDVIVGFPGETEAEFAESLAFIEQMQFARLHIFRYSPRKGTAAATMPGQVSKPVGQERSRQMNILNARLESDFMRQFVGTSRPVLWESSEPFGLGQRWSGLTDNYLRVVAEAPNDHDLHNTITQTQLLEVLPGMILGHIPGISPTITNPTNHPLQTIP